MLLTSRVYRPLREKAAQLIEAVARAVHHAHQRGVLPGPKALGIYSSRKRASLLTDFGLAKMLAEDQQSLTHGRRHWHANYMCHQAGAEESSDVTVQLVTSLGVILYELLWASSRSVARLPVMSSTSSPGRPKRRRVSHPLCARDLATICPPEVRREISAGTLRQMPAGARGRPAPGWTRRPIQAHPIFRCSMPEMDAAQPQRRGSRHFADRPGCHYGHPAGQVHSRCGETRCGAGLPG